MSHFSLRRADRYGPSLPRRTSRLEPLQEGKPTVSKVYREILGITSGCGSCTGAFWVCLELPHRGGSAHCRELGPQLVRFLGHQEDTEGFKRAGAGMPKNIIELGKTEAADLMQDDAAASHHSTMASSGPTPAGSR
ncbi:hypothetical protein ATANTOWER_002511 [Ataeniobius toweri]|uniref:Uncharacterized protein n=1 Tax=Ataeniobius toweri TaxID=208326 RepID=A0ABU7BM65_9TELE|nr:hypothetical protein [Ataeniobius toweri]